MEQVLSFRNNAVCDGRRLFVLSEGPVEADWGSGLTNTYPVGGASRAPWGEARFLEAFGVGLFAHGLARYNPKGDKSLVRAAWAAFRTLAQHEAHELKLVLGGADRSGRYLMVEAMNTAAMVPLPTSFRATARPAATRATSDRSGM